jgi:hypothetical protein
VSINERIRALERMFDPEPAPWAVGLALMVREARLRTLAGNHEPISESEARRLGREARFAMEEEFR